MATLNRTFSVKNGIDVANTIIVDSNRNLSNIANASFSNVSIAANAVVPLISLTNSDGTNSGNTWSFKIGEPGNYDGFFMLGRGNFTTPGDFYLTAAGIPGFSNGIEIADTKAVMSGSSGSLAYYKPYTAISGQEAEIAFRNATPNTPGKLRINGWWNNGSWNYVQNVFCVTANSATSGNVGINTANPGAPLHVLGDLVTFQGIGGSNVSVIDGSAVRATSELYLDTQVSTGGNISIRPRTAAAMTILAASGNVGIGTASPGYKLDVSDSSRIAGTLHFFGALRNYSGDMTLNQAVDANMIFQTNLTERMRISNTGNVLVGLSTTLTNGRLQVNGGIGLSGNTQIRQATNGDGNTFQVFATQVVAGPTNSTSYNYAGGGLVASVAALDSAVLIDAGRATSTDGRFKVLNTTSGNVAMSLEKNGVYTIYANGGTGNVGIGTGSPAARLHVNGNMDAGNNRLLLDNDGGGSAMIYAGVTGQHNSGMSLSTGAAGGGTQVVRMVIGSAGNVGIGTITPSNRLSVESNGDCFVATTSGNNAGNAGIKFGGAGDRGSIYGTSSYHHYIEPNAQYGNVNVIIKAKNDSVYSAKVGINTINPGYTLEVAGSFAAQTKSFVITHPTKPDMKLRYGSLEGPENGVYVRGRSKTGIIKLPDYWTGLVDESTITVNLTPVGTHQKLYVEEIVDNTVIIGGGWFDSLDFFYTVYGERKDVDKLIVEI